MRRGHNNRGNIYLNTGSFFWAGHMRACRCGSAGVRLRGVDSRGGTWPQKAATVWFWQSLFQPDFEVQIRTLPVCVCVCVINKFALFDWKVQSKLKPQTHRGHQPEFCIYFNNNDDLGEDNSLILTTYRKIGFVTEGKWTANYNNKIVCFHGVVSAWIVNSPHSSFRLVGRGRSMLKSHCLVCVCVHVIKLWTPPWMSTKTPCPHTTCMRVWTL